MSSTVLWARKNSPSGAADSATNMSDCFEATDTPDSSKNASTMETAGDQVAWKTTVLALSHSSNGTQSASGVFGTHGKAIDHGVQANAVKTCKMNYGRFKLDDSKNKLSVSCSIWAINYAPVVVVVAVEIEMQTDGRKQGEHFWMN